MTKRILTIFLLLLSLTFSLKAEDDSGNNGNGTTPGQPIKKKKGPEDPLYPKAPSRAIIIFSYHNETEAVYFDLPANVEYINILLQNSETGFTFAGYASDFAPEWHQPLTAGEYYIECTADNGDIYAGYTYI